LEEIEALGYLLGYCIYHRIGLVRGEKQLLPLCSAILAVITFNIVDVEDLLGVDFRIWEDVKRVLSV